VLAVLVSVAQVVEEDPYVAELHARAEKFDPQAERTFGYLQVTGGLWHCSIHNCIQHVCIEQCALYTCEFAS
jgi:hypothetical protein